MNAKDRFDSMPEDVKDKMDAYATGIMDSFIHSIAIHGPDCWMEYEGSVLVNLTVELPKEVAETIQKLHRDIADKPDAQAVISAVYRCIFYSGVRDYIHTRMDHFKAEARKEKSHSPRPR